MGRYRLPSVGNIAAWSERRSSFSLRASLKPFGIGEQRPNNFGEVTRAIWENRDRAGYAWRILNEGVCDGCALGTKGMRDWTMDGVHLCNVRLRLLRMNTMPAFDPALLADATGLRGRSSAELRAIGRLPRPMVRRAGDPGFSPISWDDALDLAAERIRAAGPDRLGAYLTSRGTANETYYAAQKAVRAMGSNSIDNAARVCHSPSTFGLKEAIGVAATTCSYTDWLKSDLIVFIGSNVANNQPVTTKYLHHAKREGARVAVLNPYREPGMERYWIPSIPTSAVFGTKIADAFFSLNVGGDLAFLTGALRHLVEQGWVDRAFVEASTTGFGELEERLGERTWEELEASAGATREQMLEFARLIGEADRGVLVWSMGVTQHEHGEDNVRAIVNLGLARGWVGREGCGLMPIRGHSGVQGGAEMGCYATALPGGLAVNADNAATIGGQWGFDVPGERGRTAPEMIDAAHAGELEVLLSIGGNFLEVLPDPAHVREALGRVPLRVHYDIVLSSQMLVDPADTVLLLPATTRYEIPGGVTETSTERRVILSPEVRGPPGRGGATGVGGAARPGPASEAGPRRGAHLSGWPRGVARGDRARGAPVHGHRGSGRGRRQLPVRRRAVSLRLRVPHARRQSPLLCDRSPAARASRRPVRGVHPPRQAVQLDGAGAQGLAHWRRPRRGDGERPGRRSSGSGERRRGDPSLRARRDERAGADRTHDPG